MDKIQSERKIEYDRFLKPILPPWISEISNSNFPDPDSKPTPTGGPKWGGKRRPKEGKQGKLIHNNAVPARLQISREEYKDNLAHLKHKGTRPAKCVKWALPRSVFRSMQVHPKWEAWARAFVEGGGGRNVQIPPDQWNEQMRNRVEAVRIFSV